jgi:hypothetical protein
VAINSVLVVADNIGIDTSGIQLAFLPGDQYPVRGVVRLFVRGQPFPPPTPAFRLGWWSTGLSGPPTRVVPTISSVHLSYGRLGQGQAPAPIEPDEHWLRELTFNASYVRESWEVHGDEATVDIQIEAGLRDNTPPGEQSVPDDPFVVFMNVQALCIWTAQITALSTILGATGSIRGVLGR